MYTAPEDIRTMDARKGGVVPDKIEAFIILLFLLPGFVGLIVYEIVAEVPKRETFDKVVVALVLTVLASVIHGFIGTMWPYFGAPAGLEKIVAMYAAKTDAQAAQNALSGNAIIAGLGWTTAVAVILGFVFALMQNKGVAYTLLYEYRVAKRTGAIDVWHQVFSRGNKCWVRLRYKNGAVLVGYAAYFSEDSNARALFVAKAIWHLPVTAGGVEFSKMAPGDITTFASRPVAGPGVLVTNFDDVIAIDQVN